MDAAVLDWLKSYFADAAMKSADTLKLLREMKPGDRLCEQTITAMTAAGICFEMLIGSIFSAQCDALGRAPRNDPLQGLDADLRAIGADLQLLHGAIYRCSAAQSEKVTLPLAAAPWVLLNTLGYIRERLRRETDKAISLTTPPAPAPAETPAATTILPNTQRPGQT